MKSKKICYKGTKNDTYLANAYALKCMYISFALLFFCWVLDLLGIFIVDITIMNFATAGAAILCVVAFLYAFLIGIDSRLSRYVVMLLLVGMATVAGTELAYHTTMFFLFPLVCSAQYFDKKISLFTAVITCAGIAVSVLVGYRIGLCDSNMLLLTYTTSNVHSAALLSGDFAVNTDKSLMFLFFVFPRWLMVLALMPLLNHVARDVQIRTERELMARHMAEMDGLTGLYNRTKYLQGLSTYYPNCEQVAVLFFDINNLKEMNDTKGHEYGDILICGLAEELRERDADNCKSYRIGGDEFVMILEGSSVRYAEDIQRELETVLRHKVLDLGITLSVAVGMAAGRGRSIENLVKQADERMYQNKLVMKAAAN